MLAVRDWMLEPPTAPETACEADGCCVMDRGHSGPCVSEAQVVEAAARIPASVRITRSSLWEALLETLPVADADADVHAMGAAVEIAERARAVQATRSAWWCGCAGSPERTDDRCPSCGNRRPAEVPHAL